MACDRGSTKYRDAVPHVQRALSTCIQHSMEKRICLVSVQNIITIKNPHIQEVSSLAPCRMLYDGPICCDCADQNGKIVHSPDDEERILSSSFRKKLANGSKQGPCTNERLDSADTEVSLKANLDSDMQPKPISIFPPTRASPFKSPATQRVVNLRVPRESPYHRQRSMWKHKINEENNTDESLQEQRTPNEAVLSEIDTSDGIGPVGACKSRRGSVALKPATERGPGPNTNSMAQTKKDSTINRTNSMFCGIPKARKCGSETKSSASLVSSLLSLKDQECHTMMPKRPSILQEKTNSPMNKPFDACQVLDLRPAGNSYDTPNSRFFLKDLEFEEEKDKANDVDQCTSIPHHSVSKEYLKKKEANTKANEGYTTVITRKKAVIGLFKYPKTYFRKSARSRLVYFDVNGWVSAHNDNPSIKSIYVENTAEPSFEWHGEKSVVDIVKRVDLELEFD